MKPDRLIQAALGLMFVAFFGTLYLALHDNVVKVGDRAPDFSIKADNGRTITAHDFGGKLLLLNFWASWCEPCVQEAPTLSTLAKTLGPSGLVVLGVSEDKDPKAYQEFLTRFKVPFLTARDPSTDIKTKYGTIQIPESYLIDTKGRVVEKVISDADWASQQMIEHVKSLL